MKLKIIQNLFLLLLFMSITSWVTAQVEVIEDGSFEAGTPHPVWYEYSSNFGTPICDFSECGNGGGSALPRTGNYFLWFGGIGAAETGYVYQTVTIPEAYSELRFWFRNAASSGNGSDYLQVQIDDIPVWTVYEGNPLYQEYTEIVIDISAYANNQPHKVEFYSVCYGPAVTNFIVDDVSIVPPPPVPVSWISIVLVFIAIGAITIYRLNKRRILTINS
jgi:hypothetical protein